MEPNVGSLSSQAKVLAGLQIVALIRENLPDNTAANLLADQVEERANELKAILEAPSEQDLYMQELEEVQAHRDNAYRAMIMILQANKICPEDEDARLEADRILQQIHPIDFIVGALLSDTTVLYHRLVWLQDEEQMKTLRRFGLLPFLHRLEEKQNRFDNLLDKRVTARESRGVSVLRVSRPLDRSLQMLLAFIRETCEPACYLHLQSPLIEAQQMAGTPGDEVAPLY
ncbi:MAG: hypothetical protein CVU65_09235 [Deltaproteobacteria bacterium HGW-Deltaproteobacteria-22]|nr:MAG: hypothetical protein CVU65_09235 [Deltaproteobacteria bacterium HGW-Deltaproteobacteria-22]